MHLIVLPVLMEPSGVDGALSESPWALSLAPIFASYFDHSSSNQGRLDLGLQLP